MLRGKIPHFRLTCVAQKRCCLSSLMWQQEGLAMGLSATLRVLVWTLDSISHLTRISIDIYKYDFTSDIQTRVRIYVERYVQGRKH